MEKAGVDFQGRQISYITDTTNVLSSVLVVNENGKLIYITGYQKWFVAVIIFLIIFSVMITRWLLLYWKICSKYKKTAEFIDAEKYLQRTRIKRKKVDVGISSVVSSPLTVGIIRPVIFLPVDSKQYEDSMEEIICHELKYIEGMDILSRFLTFIVIVTEWFNPLAYYLFIEDMRVSEMLCDEEAIKGKTNTKKSAYIKCIIKAAQKPSDSKIVTISFGMHKKLLRERIERIMGKKQKKLWRKSIAVMIMVFCFIMSSIPAFAYQKPVKWTITPQSGAEGWNDTDVVVFADDGTWKNSQMDFSRGDIVFTSDEGAICYNSSLKANNQNQMERACSHSYKSGTVSQHRKFSDGSCVVAVYNAQQCTKCGNIIYESEISKITYQPCIHQP